MEQLIKAGVPVDGITCHSRVCGIHFVGGSKSHNDKDDIPTLFPGKHCSDAVHFTATIFSHCLELINSRESSGRQRGVFRAIFMCTSARYGFPGNRSRRDRLVHAVDGRVYPTGMWPKRVYAELHSFN